MIYPVPKPAKREPKAKKPIKRSRIKRRSKRTRVMEDGRQILSPAEWSKRSAQAWLRAGARCERCHEYTGFVGEAHHKIKRGMGGGFRDDRLENLEWLCKECHREEEASGARTKMTGLK